ncbi:GtrA family protein [Burkholderiaceae bacterium FT117]|uniref:GtrA family protein n=1 Tax=Zeimonas sediminis TaxID=2944268 RepID=UPI002342C9DA|nr:GtrA family protein [Zeimonas sediminis]MCM5572096.1 GtrA family protein [Zeimonas sediminis]
MLSRFAAQFGRFALVGVAGFVVDTGITTALVELGWGPRLARWPGLALAIFITWIANGRLTFRGSGGRGPAGLSRYAAVALAAASINYGIYSALVGAIGSVVLAIVLATMVSMLLSFAGYRLFVFRD